MISLILFRKNGGFLLKKPANMPIYFIEDCVLMILVHVKEFE